MGEGEGGPEGERECVCARATERDTRSVLLGLRETERLRD
jgi:hypothetical protein